MTQERGRVKQPSTHKQGSEAEQTRQRSTPGTQVRAGACDESQ